MKTRIISSKQIIIDKRFDGSYHNAEINIYDSVITAHSSHNLSYYCSDIFTSGRNKRAYTTPNKGLPFLSNSDVAMANPFLSCNYSSIKYGFDEKAVLKEGMILTGRVGSIGQTAYVPKYIEEAKAMGSDNIIRIVVDSKYKNGFIYAFLASKIGKLSFLKHSTGGVQPFITESMVGQIPIPDFPESLQTEVNKLILESAKLREEAKVMLDLAEKELKSKAGLPDLCPEEYDYYGQSQSNRKVSCFARNIKELGTTSINAFNHSERIRLITQKMACKTIPLREAIQGGATFSSTGAPSIEVKPGKGIMMINQKDIFDNIIRGKWISNRGIKLDNLVDYGEVLIACDGTLGESELFCRAIFANEDLKGSFISSHFIRMKATEEITSGYLYTWLNSDYGFRFIRNTQAGTKLCHPINKMFLNIPIPVLGNDDIKAIDSIVKTAHSKRHESNLKELEAIQLIEQEIEKWNK